MFPFLSRKFPLCFHFLPPSENVFFPPRHVEIVSQAGRLYIPQTLGHRSNTKIYGKGSSSGGGMRLIYARCTHTADSRLTSQPSWKRSENWNPFFCAQAEAAKGRKVSKDIPVREKSMLEEGKSAAVENIFPSKRTFSREIFSQVVL